MLSLVGSVAANTCIKHFSPGAEYLCSNRHALDVVSALNQGGLISLSAPYTSAPVATLAIKQSTNTSQSNKEQWYRLDGLQLGASYELRISHPAATGIDFEIALYSADGILKLYNKTAASAVANAAASNPVGTHSLLDIVGQPVVYAKVTAYYSGYSNWPDVENWPAAYIIVLEKHVAGLPVQALKLIALLVLIVVTSLGVVTPWLLAKIDKVVAEEYSSKPKPD
ncbi:hypothetical protein H4R26_004297 [Coemansia thaxteri]|uniref:Uncharacterized protein n=1 Tax=Coemansia thaxteri TaxID=2663907 RepID=A0A9W8BGH6_9FUNG|nr:hypothetical protein H4R26_004297 [Coemansia thaxteri]KAJ2482762.1 hypothetical protein EV174_003125 [Coemansia sp. RSA 2320]